MTEKEDLEFAHRMFSEFCAELARDGGAARTRLIAQIQMLRRSQRAKGELATNLARVKEAIIKLMRARSDQAVVFSDVREAYLEAEKILHILDDAIKTNELEG